MLKKSLLSICLILLIYLLTPLFTKIIADSSSTQLTKSSKQLSDKQKLRSTESEEELSDLPKERAEYFFKQRAFPLGIFPLDWKAKAIEHMKKNRPKLENKLASGFTAIGPAPINNGQTFGPRGRVAGRVTAITINPTEPNTVYLGGAQGGVWKTTDAGRNWQPITEDAPTQAIGAIVLDPRDPQTIYVGTGEGNLSGDSFFGMGILKSTNGGKSWVNLAAKTFLGLSFSNLAIDRNNPETLYASIARGVGAGRSRNPLTGRPGIYKSTDSGVSWANILSDGEPTFFSATDIEIDPSDSSILYATFFNNQDTGVFKTTDAGRTWAKLAGGLPRQDVSRVDIGVAPSNPNIVYASVGNSRSGDLLGMFKSTNKGVSWASISSPPRSGFGNVCQCFYDNVIVVDPDDANLVYYAGVSLYRTSNGGQSWNDLAPSFGIHPDFHVIAINNTPGRGKQIYVGNDGGVWASFDRGGVFENSNGKLNLTQFQSIAIHPNNPNISIGGTQDNGTNMYLGSSDVWEHADDGDGGFTAIDQKNPNTMYHTFFRVSLRRSDQGGKLGSWFDVSQGISRSDPVLFYAPFILDPNNQNTLYFGTDKLYRSSNQGGSWQPISSSLTGTLPGAAISAIAVAPTKATSIYTGSSDGSVFTSQDGGSRFQDVTDNLPSRYISDIVADPIDPLIVYVSLAGFTSGHIYKSVSGGKNWQDISGNLPDVPAMALVINPNNSKNLFLGTDIGVFQTLDGGINWQLIPGMPMVSVFDLAINSKLQILRAATHGRGVYELTINNTIDTAAPSITVNSPNGTETLESNNQILIKWKSSDDVSVSEHEILLSTDEGATFPITVAKGLNGMAQEFLWRVPQLTTEQARIRITAVDLAGNSNNDISDSNFSIKPSGEKDFSLDLGVTTLEVKRGKSVQIIVSILRSGGFDSQITITPDPNTLKTLQIKAKPSLISTSENTATFSLKVKKKAPLGKQSLSFVGKDTQGRSRNTILTLNIQ